MEKISLKELAQYIGIDRSYLTRLFKEYEGLSVQGYIFNYRMELASKFLENNQLSIGDIAHSVGYSDQLEFSKAFKSKFGLPPSAWRLNLQTVKEF